MRPPVTAAAVGECDMRLCEQVSWRWLAAEPLMKVCLFRGRATTLLPTAQSVLTFPVEIQPTLSRALPSSQHSPLGLHNALCIAKARCSQQATLSAREMDRVGGSLWTKLLSQDFI